MKNKFSQVPEREALLQGIKKWVDDNHLSGPIQGEPELPAPDPNLLDVVYRLKVMVGPKQVATELENQFPGLTTKHANLIQAHLPNESRKKKLGKK